MLSFRPTVVGFNPRTRKGCDNYHTVDPEVVQVSIHAPVKDATDYAQLRDELSEFQSTHP